MKMIRNETTHLIDRAKESDFEKLGKKLCDPSIGIKSFWMTIKKLLSKSKTSVLPPLFVNGVFVTNFQTKADIFNDHFVKQCSIVPNSSLLPPFFFRTQARLCNLEINQTKILQLIRKLNTNKAHGSDELSIKMTKLCDTALVLPLSLIFEKSISTCVFPDTWKKANVLPIHKKESRQLKTNYRPISLLPICGKIFEKIIFDAIYDHLCKNQLLTLKRSGFRPGDSTVNQLIAITHQIDTAFEKFPSRETRAVFLDISKAFDKVWHEGLLFKLKSSGIAGDLLKLIQGFLYGRQQRVVLNGKNPEWHYVIAGVPQGSVLGPLFFLVYINDLVDNICSDAKLFADDTSLFKVVYKSHRQS